MIENIKAMLGDAAANYPDKLIELYLGISIREIKAYCGRKLDAELEAIAERITVIKLNRINTEGLSSQSYSGVSESYIDGYPEDIMMVLRKKRKLRLL